MSLSEPADGSQPRREPTHGQGRSRRKVWWLMGGLIAAAIALCLSWYITKNRDINPPTSGPSSPFRNTAPEVAYVGSAACLDCHPGHQASLRRTGMGRSMALVDPDLCPPDATVDHPVSKRRYQVHRKDGRFWHRESLLIEGADAVVLNDVPLHYVVGSGRHAQTFLAERDGFLVESPLTWYASRQAWAMSPGYDRPEHAGFQRAVGETCLFCHAGRAEVIGETYHKVKVIETTISCERCHGPGALHVERHLGPSGAPADARGADGHGLDDTIVNPAHLPRALAEAVCQQCHLRSTAAVAARGHSVRDFRPGLPLQDFRHDFHLETPKADFTVTGHVEQLQLSRCYQGSAMTCRTCHEPHHEPRPSQRDAHYQKSCLSCHRPAQCTVDPARRDKQSPANQCVACHMPRAPTEVAHVALTHHRIGKHDGPPPAPDVTAAADLRLVLGWSSQSERDRRRSLGLGYVEVFGSLSDSELRRDCGRRAADLLHSARDDASFDPAIELGLLLLEPTKAPEEVVASADRILAGPNLAARERTEALWLRADALARQRQFDAASADLRRLTTLRRKATDWLVLADCERAAGNMPGAIDAFAQAVQVNPRLWKVQRYLADHYRREGNAAKAKFHQDRAAP